MKPQIQITDNRTEKNFAKENMEVSIIPTVSTTLQVVNDDGSVEEKTFNVLGTAQTSTLKDLDNDLSNLQSQLTQAQAQVDSLTKQVADKQAIRDEVENEVNTAFEALPAVKEVELPAEIIP